MFLVITLTINLTFLEQGHACVYPPPENGKLLTDYVSEKLVEAKLEPSITFNISIEGSAVTISLALNEQISHIAWKLSEDCDYRPVSVSSEHSWMAALNLQSLARDFPLKPTTSSSEQATLRPQVETVHLHEESVYPLNSHTTGILWIFYVLILWTLERRKTNASLTRWLGLVPVLMLLLWGMLPELAEPFAPLSAKIRILGSTGNPFFDPGHPFLFFFLNSPITRLYSEPEILRTLPFIFVVGETILLFVTASRYGGILGGILASSWFVLEVPRRHGLYDFSGWDLAGLFLMAQVYWLQHHESRKVPRAKDFAILLLLLLGGFSSSWLMVVPSFVMVFVLFLKWRNKPQVHWFFFAIGLVALFGFGWMWVSTSGNAFPKPNTLSNLFRDIVTESPFGRTPYIAVFVLIGGHWLLYNWKRTTGQFVILSIIGTIAAILLSGIFLSAAQGYYAGLITPLILFATGIGSSRSLNWFYDYYQAGGHRRFVGITTLGMLACLILATLSWPKETLYSTNRWANSISEFALHFSREPGRVLTNYPHFGVHLDFERGQQAGDLRLANGSYPKTVFGVLSEECQLPGGSPEHRVELPSALPIDLTDKNPWYLVLYYLLPDARTRCLGVFQTATCKEIAQSDDRHHFYECRNKT